MFCEVVAFARVSFSDFENHLVALLQSEASSSGSLEGSVLRSSELSGGQEEERSSSSLPLLSTLFVVKQRLYLRSSARIC